MNRSPRQRMERHIARARLILSVVALIAVYVDPTRSAFWAPARSGWFSIDPYALATLSCHLLYSSIAFAVLSREQANQRWLFLTTWIDVAFGGLIALFTEGASSPFYAFFVFAVLAVGLREGLRRTLTVTAVSVVLYLGLIIVSAPEAANAYIMRLVYLTITGYLVGYIGQQRLNLDERIGLLVAADQRNQIGRDLHDGYAQSLAGVTLRIERCRELLRRGRGEQVAEALVELQGAVNREFDSLRAYSRSLAGLEAEQSLAPSRSTKETEFVVRVDLRASGAIVDHVLQIMREGVTNVRRHAHATSASLRVHPGSGDVVIRIEDDGVGFDSEGGPWSIRSRVNELGGRLDVGGAAGGSLMISLPLA